MFEVLTGYMTADFTSFWAFDPERNAIQTLSKEPGEQTQPVILSTPQQTHAMGPARANLDDALNSSGRGLHPQQRRETPPNEKGVS